MTRAVVQSTFGVFLLAAVVGCNSGADAQSGGKPVIYKLGTFERANQAFVGIVLNDSKVVDIAQANTAYESKNASAPKLSMPVDMKQLILRYDTELKPRLAAIAADEAASKATVAYAFDITALKVLPPVRPSLILNAGGNYTEHSQGIAREQARQSGQAADAAPPAQSAPGIWERKPDDKRDNPYLFQKSPTVVIGAFDNIVAPRGRERLDFECEFATVIGKPTKYVSVDKAADHVFGYTIQIDVSDRGGRGDRKMGGSDWLIGKNHDTFGPIGPFIVPKEFMPTPMNTRHTFKLNGEVMQDSNTSRMDHNIYELTSYASNILTLNAGDIISGGSPAGTNIERAEPRWMRAGDKAVCEIEGIGAQTHDVVPESSTGATN